MSGAEEKCINAVGTFLSVRGSILRLYYELSISLLIRNVKCRNHLWKIFLIRNTIQRMNVSMLNWIFTNSAFIIYH